MFDLLQQQRILWEGEKGRLGRGMFGTIDGYEQIGLQGLFLKLSDGHLTKKALPSTFGLGFDHISTSYMHWDSNW